MKGGLCLLSQQPPDVPVAFTAYGSVRDAAIAAEAGGYEVVWCGDASAEYERIMAERNSEPVESRW